MKTIAKKKLWLLGILLLALFALWTWLIRHIDVRPWGQAGTDIGFAVLNTWFHRLTGVHMQLYGITDWLGLVPILLCLVGAGVGCVQLVRRKGLWKVDADLLILGVYYLAVLGCYVLFERIPINYRPVLIHGVLEVSYPSSTTLLVLGVMPTLAEQAPRRFRSPAAVRVIRAFAVSFSAFMVLGRLICGVHWLTDIIGSVLLCAGLFCLYRAAVLKYKHK